MADGGRFLYTTGGEYKNDSNQPAIPGFVVRTSWGNNATRKSFAEQQRNSVFNREKRPTISADKERPGPQVDVAEEVPEERVSKEKPVPPQPVEPTVEFEYDEAWMRSFQWMKTFLILLGRWPLTYKQDKVRRGYLFEFSWTCPGFVIYVLTTLFTLYGLVAGVINVVNVLMKEKISELDFANRTKTEIFEQALAERHTMVLIIILGSYGINMITSVCILARRHEIAVMFTKWTRFLQSSKLSSGTNSTYYYVGIAAGNYFIIGFVLMFLALVRTPMTETSTLIGGPTVVSMLFMRHFNPPDYMDNFVGSSTHSLMHYAGIFIFFYVVTLSNAFMFLFLWLIKSVENTISSWNERVVAVLELSAEELKEQTSIKDRTTYEALYNDHIGACLIPGIVRMLTWFNDMLAYYIEPYVLFQTVKIVYQMYLAVIVVETNGKPLTEATVGKYFIRKRDHYPAILITYENVVMLLVVLLASSWLEDAAYDSYDDLRKKSLLRGTYSERESFFFLSMFQSFTSTTSMAIYGGHFFCLDRYSILHVVSAIMSNFLVVYQFRPLFDMDTVGTEFDELRNLTGAFLTKLEGLPPNHTVPVKFNF